MLRTIALAALVSTATPALAQGGGDMTPNAVDVVEVASAAGQFNTLLKAVSDADLAETFATASDVTVLAPIDAAFTAVPDFAAVEADKAKLAEVLKFHVIPAAYLVADIPAGDTQVETLGGQTLTLTNTDGSITVTTPSGAKAMVVRQDLKADNGVVHAIDHVLLP